MHTVLGTIIIAAFICISGTASFMSMYKAQNIVQAIKGSVRCSVVPGVLTVLMIVLAVILREKEILDIPKLWVVGCITSSSIAFMEILWMYYLRFWKRADRISVGG